MPDGDFRSSQFYDDIDVMAADEVVGGAPPLVRDALEQLLVRMREGWTITRDEYQLFDRLLKVAWADDVARAMLTDTPDAGHGYLFERVAAHGGLRYERVRLADGKFKT